MPKWTQYRDRFAHLRQLWDEAEEIVKQAEQTCEKVCVPAIKELRYAGRRFVEIAALIEDDDDDKRISDLIADADFNCICAKHDAIDAIISKAALDLKAAKDSIGHDTILKTLPAFPSIVKLIVDARKKIVVSRKTRKNRQAIYDTVKAVEWPKILEFYEVFLVSEEMMVEMAKQDRRKKLASAIVGIAGLIGVGYTIWDHYDKGSTPTSPASKTGTAGAPSRGQP